MGVLLNKDISLIEAQIYGGNFPHSVMLAGEKYSGRLTVALEIARLLSCLNDKTRECRCRSCRSYDDYTMDNVIVLGSRDYKTRLNAALNSYAILKTDKSYKELLKTIRLLLLRFNANIETKEQNKLNASAALGELLLSVEENSEKNFKLIKSGLKQSEVLTNKESPLTINQIRDIQKWVNQTNFGNRNRFVILEELESCSEGAANSLLKLLEEPPKNTYIIVIGENPAKLLATLLSRLRLYRIPSFNEQQKNEILRDNYFVDGSTYSSLEEFILERGNVATKELKNAATQFCNAIVNKTDLKREELEAISSLVDETVSLKYFLDELIISLGDLFKNGKISMSVAQRYSNFTKESVNKALVYNQNSRLLIDSLYYRLMGEV